MNSEKSVGQALELVRADHKAQAREILKAILIEDRNNPAAWAVMVQVAENRQEVITCLKQVLRLKPDDSWASKRLRELQAAAPPPVTFQEFMSAAPSAPKPAPIPTASLPTSDTRDPGQSWVTPSQVGLSTVQPIQSLSDSALPAKSFTQASSLAAPSTSPSYSKAVLIAALLIVTLVCVAIGYIVYEGFLAEHPEQGPQALEAARLWTVVTYGMDFQKSNSMTCSRYADQPDLFTGLINKRLEEGLQGMVNALGVRPQPPSNLTYTIKSIKKSEARIKVTGFMSEFRSFLGSAQIKEDMFRQLDERVYIMRREDGQWKWCGYE
jgi:hypothetical protein